MILWQARAKESPIKEFLFNLALRKKKEEIDAGIFRNDSVWDQLAFKKIHKLLGGRVKAIFCGSAPLDPNVMAFARAAMGAYVMEGGMCAGSNTLIHVILLIK